MKNNLDYLLDRILSVILAASMGGLTLLLASMTVSDAIALRDTWAELLNLFH